MEESLLQIRYTLFYRLVGRSGSKVLHKDTCFSVIKKVFLTLEFQCHCHSDMGFPEMCASHLHIPRDAYLLTHMKKKKFKIPGYHIRVGHTLLSLLLAQGSCLQRAETTMRSSRIGPYHMPRSHNCRCEV